MIPLVVLTCGFGALVNFGLDENRLGPLDPALETIQADEASKFKKVAAVIQAFVAKQFLINSRKAATSSENHSLTSNAIDSRDLLPAKPDAHRKSHGCYPSTLEVRPDILSVINRAIDTLINERNSEAKLGKVKPGPMPEILHSESDLGVFQPGQIYNSIVRFSNANPKNRHDRTPDVRGIAVKLLRAVDKDRLTNLSSAELNSNTALDILANNFPTFFLTEQNPAENYAKLTSYFLRGTLDDNQSRFKERWFAGLSLFKNNFNAMEVNLGMILDGSVIRSALAENYFSMTAYRLGTHGSHRAVKYIWKPEPCQAEQQSELERFLKTNRPDWATERNYSDPRYILKLRQIPPYKKKYRKQFPSNYLRKNIEETLARDSFCYSLYLQFYRDQISTNIEDSSDLWAESVDDISWWKREVIPSSLNPLWKIYPMDRSAYLKKIEAKSPVRPVKVAQLRINQTVGPALGQNLCDSLSFNSWNGNIEHHKPLGVVNRMRREAYFASRKIRQFLNSFSLNSKDSP